MIKGIEHTATAASDLEALADWYVSTLGFVVNYHSANAIFVKAPDGSMIEIIRAEGDRGPQTLKTQGIRHLALAVDNFESAYENLRAKNVAFVSEPAESKGNKVVFFTDPEGNYLHLLYRSTPLP
jgi:catechol 2,3-dioxygenase-like lactoylglutathione lyase family enzyme